MEFEHPRWPPNSKDRVKRPLGSPTPCGDCPKCRGSTEEPSPKVGMIFDLSPKNQKTLELYYKVKAGVIDVKDLDDITITNLGFIEEAYQTFNQQNLSSMAQGIAMSFVRKM